MADNLELKACPFCGCYGLSAAYPRIIRDKACGVVECHTDNCYAMVVADTLPQAIAAWNTRTPTPPAGDVVERVARAIGGNHGYDWDALTDAERNAWRSDATAALAAGSGERWLPIESAPKDGTRIIIGWLRHGEVRGVSAAKWVTAEFWADLEGGEPSDFESGWFEPNYEDELCANVWMPMPAPPALNEQEG